MEVRSGPRHLHFNFSDHLDVTRVDGTWVVQLRGTDLVAEGPDEETARGSLIAAWNAYRADPVNREEYKRFILERAVVVSRDDYQRGIESAAESASAREDMSTKEKTPDQDDDRP